MHNARPDAGSASSLLGPRSWQLMNNVTRPSISFFPEWALRARLAFWVIYAFLMRAADDPIQHGNGLGVIVADELQCLRKHSRIASDVVIRKPLAHRFGVRMLMPNNTYNQLCCLSVVWTIERNCSHWIPTKAFLGLLVECFLGFVFHPCLICLIVLECITPKLSCRRSGQRLRREPNARQRFGRPATANCYVLFFQWSGLRLPCTTATTTVHSSSTR